MPFTNTNIEQQTCLQTQFQARCADPLSVSTAGRLCENTEGACLQREAKPWCCLQSFTNTCVLECQKWSGGATKDGEKKTEKAIKGGKRKNSKKVGQMEKQAQLQKNKKQRQRDEGSLHRGRQLENWRSCTLIANVL